MNFARELRAEAPWLLEAVSFACLVWSPLVPGAWPWALLVGALLLHLASRRAQRRLDQETVDAAELQRAAWAANAEEQRLDDLEEPHHGGPNAAA